MRKTTLFLLSSVSILAACYTSPEMNEGRYEDLYAEDESACRYNDDTYQHKGLRRCLESKAAYESANKKTVQIIQQKDGTALVVPKTYDDSLMVEKNRVYQVVERDSNTVFVDSNVEVSEEDIAKLPEKVVEEDVGSAEPPLVIEESIDDVVEENANETLVMNRTSIDYDDTVESEDFVITRDDTLPVVQVVVEAENPAPPQIVPVVEEVLEVEENIEPEEEECDCEEECCEEDEDTDEKDVSFVMQPSDEELIISIKSKKKQASSSEKNCSCGQKKAKKIETFKKNEKEFLPLEEK